MSLRQCVCSPRELLNKSTDPYEARYVHHVTVGHSEFVPFNSYHPGIYLERLRKTVEIFRIVCAPTEIRAGRLPERSLKPYRLSQLACCCDIVKSLHLLQRRDRLTAPPPLPSFCGTFECCIRAVFAGSVLCAGITDVRRSYKSISRAKRR